MARATRTSRRGGAFGGTLGGRGHEKKNSDMPLCVQIQPGAPVSTKYRSFIWLVPSQPPLRVDSIDNG
jgi:hypothetical protein